MEARAEEVRLLGETAGTAGDSDLGTFSTNVTVVGESMLRSLSSRRCFASKLRMSSCSAIASLRANCRWIATNCRSLVIDKIALLLRE